MWSMWSTMRDIDTSSGFVTYFLKPGTIIQLSKAAPITRRGR